MILSKSKMPPSLRIHSWVILLLLFSSLNPIHSVECSDYYDLFMLSFQDVNVDKTEYAPNETVSITAMVTNTKPVPLRDVLIRVQLLQRREGSVDQMIDDFLLNTPIHLSPYGIGSISTNWTVPQSAQNGTYLVRLFAYSHGYQLAGVSSFLDLFGAQTQFRVVSDNPLQLRFDLNHVSINDRIYNFTNSFENQPFFENDSLSLSLPLQSVRDGNASVNFRLYYWEDVKQDELVLACARDGYAFCDLIYYLNLLTRTEIVSFGTSNTSNLTYRLGSLPVGVYTLVVTATQGDAKAITKIRLVVAGSRPNSLIAFSGLDRFPLMGSSSGGFVACYGLLTSGSGAEPPLSIDYRIIAKDEEINGTEILDTSSSQNVFFTTFKSRTNIQDASLLVLLRSGEDVIDYARIPYSFTALPFNVTLTSNVTGREESIFYSFTINDEVGNYFDTPCMVYAQKNNSLIFANTYGSGKIEGNITVPEGEYNISIACDEVQRYGVFPLYVSPRKIPPPADALQFHILLIIVGIIISAIIVIYVVKKLKDNIDMEERLQKEEQRIRKVLLKKRGGF